MKAILLAVFFILPHLASGAASSVIIAGDHNATAPALRMRVRADFVAIPLTIRNDAKDPAIRADEIEKTLKVISDNIKKHSDLHVKPGVLSLSAQNKASKKVSSYDSYDDSSAKMYVLGALKPEATVFAVTKKIYQVVSGIPFIDKTKITLGTSVLGIEDPEKYRSQLLSMISKSAAETRKALGTGGVIEFNGLENPVSVMQSGESEVVLFIDYQLKIQVKTP